MFSPRNTTNALLAVLVFFISGAILQSTRSILIPLVLACFLTTTLYPIIQRLDRYIPRWLLLITVLGFFSVFLLSDALLFVFHVEEISQKLPQYNRRIQSMLEEINTLAKQYGITPHWKSLSPQEGFNWLFRLAASSVGSIFTFVGQTVLVLFIMLFLFLESNQFAPKIRVAFENDSSTRILQSMRSINERLQQYMVTKTLISLLTGVLTAICTYLLGVDFYMLWGTTAFLLNFIPNIGSIVAVIPPVIIALLQQENSYGLALATLAVLTFVQMMVGNVLEPRITGRSLDLSPLVVFLSLIFWGWMWGSIGMLLAVPLTVTMKVICEHTESLRPIAILLGGPPREDALPPSALLSTSPETKEISKPPAPQNPEKPKSAENTEKPKSAETPATSKPSEKQKKPSPAPSAPPPKKRKKRR